MSVSRLHHCIDQIKIAERTKEPPAVKCRCRKYIGLSEATKMVENGEASWVVIKRTQEAAEKTCSLCGADPEIKNCANCGGRGKEPGTIVIEEYGNDLVLISAPPADGKKRSSALKKKTPRTATLERKHVELAFVGPALTPCELKEGCPFRPGEPKHNHGSFAIKLEPPDDPVARTGRQYDWGRGI